MAQKVYVVDGRQFRTESDYACAKRDKILIDKLRGETNFGDKRELERLRKELYDGKYKFRTLLGQDFLDEVEGRLKTPSARRKGAGGQETFSAGKRAGIFGRKASAGKEGSGPPGGSGQGSSAGSGRHPSRGRAAASSGRKEESPEMRNASFRNQASGTASGGSRGGTGKTSSQGGVSGAGSGMDAIVARELERRERRRKLMIAVCGAAAVFCLGYVGIYTYHAARTENDYQELKELKENAASSSSSPSVAPQGPLYTLDEEPGEREVLEEYKNLLIKNQKLIGWVKIDDTNIDFPVMQTTDNEYYLKHNIFQEYDKNGSIFMDKDCDVLKPSTNFILYGHHTKTGKMFGKLELYEDEDYYKEHRYIDFDTIYEKGTYEIMYVFRSRVYKEDEIVFKYYQFIDANGEKEFDSYMQEMAAMSFYDTGVTAQYGDQLLTLSTCDYQQKDGRFVVVAKKIAKE